MAATLTSAMKADLATGNAKILLAKYVAGGLVDATFTDADELFTTKDSFKITEGDPASTMIELDQRGGEKVGQVVTAGESTIEAMIPFSATALFDYFYNNAIQVRTEILKKNYFETLTELQKNILNELPKTFTTAEGLKIACKLIEGKARVSDRQFKTYLKDVKLFKRLSHGSYEKIV